jgi:hypothetical protein
MTIHSTIRNGVRALIASLLAACLLALWPLLAEAKSNTTHTSNSTKTTTTVGSQSSGAGAGKATFNPSSPVAAKKKGSTKCTSSLQCRGFGEIRGESIDSDHKDR